MRGPRFVAHHRWGVRLMHGGWGWKCRCGATCTGMFIHRSSAQTSWDIHLEDHIIFEIDKNRK